MIICLLCIILFQSTIPFVSAYNATCFARITKDDVYLYKTPTSIDDYANIYFTLPKTYFVELTASTNDMFYSCNYLNFKGYVKKDCVQAVAGTPSNPYLNNISFRIYAELSRDLRTEPTTASSNSSQVTYIPLLSRNLTYYGSIKGECLIEGRTNVWYYCKYSADKDYYGYVYSDFCDEKTPIFSNNEEFNYIENPIFQPIIQSDPSTPLNNNLVGIIIGILSIPALIFVFMILKGKSILTHEKTKDKEIIDY